MAEFAKPSLVMGGSGDKTARGRAKARRCDRFNLGRRAVLQDRLAPRQLMQRQFAANVDKFFLSNR